MIIYLAQVSLQSIAELIPYSAELTKKKASMISSKVVIFHLAYSAGSHVETSASAADPVSFRCPDISFAASHLLPSLNFTDQRIMLQENGRARGSLRGGRMLRWLFGNEGRRLFAGSSRSSSHLPPSWPNSQAFTYPGSGPPCIPGGDQAISKNLKNHWPVEGLKTQMSLLSP